MLAQGQQAKIAITPSSLPAQSAGLPISLHPDVLSNGVISGSLRSDEELAPHPEPVRDEPQNGTEAATLPLDQPSISQFRSFFELLDRLDRRASQEAQVPAGASSTSSEVAKEV